MSKWKSYYFCVECDTNISESTMLYSKGVCPHCGYVSNSTVMSCITRAGKKVRTSPLWMYLFGISKYKLIIKQ